MIAALDRLRMPRGEQDTPPAHATECPVLLPPLRWLQGLRCCLFSG